jgi:methionine transaminase
MITSKLPDVGTTIFTIMSKMALDHNAVNLSQGYPDFQPPSPLLEFFRERLLHGHNQYPPMHGIAPLREQIARKAARHYDALVDEDKEITITSGATEAIFVAVQATVHAGDEVIIFDPAFDCYAPAVALAGGISRHIPLASPDFKIDFQRLADTITPRTRLIIVNSPHNPCGSVLSREEVIQFEQLVEKHDVLILSDEVYEHMVFDGRKHHSFLASESLRKRTFVVSSFGKTYHATGWKVGYCIAPPSLTSEFRKVHQFVTFTTNTPTQWAIADFMEAHPEHETSLSTFYQEKRDRFNLLMTGHGFEMTPSSGTYFQIADYSTLANIPDTVFAEQLTVDYGVAVIPISVFSRLPQENQRIVRFCFAKEDHTLTLAADRLARVKTSTAPRQRS